MQTGRLWTIGHSTHPWESFVRLLHDAGIEAVADVRLLAGSRRHPQFNNDALAEALPAAGIRYVPMRELGGRRRPRPDTRNTAWRHPAFRGYADYMETVPYREARACLAELALRERTTLMCAEALWWQCHRSLIADDFKAEGWTVLHVQSAGSAKEHPYTGAARIVDGRLDYSLPADPQGELF